MTSPKKKNNNALKLWNRDHVDVPTTSCGDKTFLCKKFLLSQEIRLTADHISKSDQKPN